MKEFLAWKEYKDNYNKRLEEITRLQILLDIEEQKLFELIRIKKQIINHKKQRAEEAI